MWKIENTLSEVTVASYIEALRNIFVIVKIIENGFITPKIVVYCNKLTKIILLQVNYSKLCLTTMWTISF